MLVAVLSVKKADWRLLVKLGEGWGFLMEIGIKDYIKFLFCCFSQERYWDPSSVNKARSNSIFVP